MEGKVNVLLAVVSLLLVHLVCKSACTNPCYVESCNAVTATPLLSNRAAVEIQHCSVMQERSGSGQSRADLSMSSPPCLDLLPDSKHWSKQLLVLQFVKLNQSSICFMKLVESLSDDLANAYTQMKRTFHN